MSRGRGALGEGQAAALCWRDGAADGAEALETLEALCADVEVVLADVHMPRVDGVTLVSHVTARWPHLPTLLMSARADDARDALAQLGLDVPVLDKPFRLVTLLESVAARLGHALPSAASSTS